jgi:hypothetical protein
MYLRQYVNESRALGAIPILVTPMNLNAWTGSDVRRVFTEGANNYRKAMMNVSKDLNVPLIDLELKSFQLFQSLGQDYITHFLFLSLQKGEYPNFIDGLNDFTHFQEMGALEMARLVVEGIQELKGNPAIEVLSAQLAPLYPLKISSNKKSAGKITLSNSYPAGSPITLRVRTNTGETFNEWQDGQGKRQSTETHHSFVMGDSPSDFWATFNGGTTTITPTLPRQKFVPGTAELIWNHQPVDAAGRVRE